MLVGPNQPRRDTVPAQLPALPPVPCTLHPRLRADGWPDNLAEEIGAEMQVVAEIVAQGAEMVAEIVAEIVAQIVDGDGGEQQGACIQVDLGRKTLHPSPRPPRHLSK